MKHSVFLAQTDTTIGFLSQSPSAINQKKGARITKPLLQEFAYFKDLSSRTPTNFRRFIRKCKKTSFILPNTKSFRVVQDSLHRQFLQNFHSLYSSSANPTNEAFSYEFALKQCDVIVSDVRGLFESQSSRILKIRHTRMKKIR